MKSFALALISFLVLFNSAYSKSRLGEYYMGFGYAMADGGKNADIEGDFLSLSANSPASDSADFILCLHNLKRAQNHKDDPYIFHLL